ADRTDQVARQHGHPFFRIALCQLSLTKITEGEEHALQPSCLAPDLLDEAGVAFVIFRVEHATNHFYLITKPEVGRQPLKLFVVAPGEIKGVALLGESSRGAARNRRSG